MLTYVHLRGKPAPAAHIADSEHDSPDKILEEILTGARRISNRVRATRLTVALVGPNIGKDYPRGYSFVTTLGDLQDAYREAKFEGRTGGYYSPPELAGIEVEYEGLPDDFALYRFYTIVSKGEVDRPHEVTDIWVERKEWT